MQTSTRQHAESDSCIRRTNADSQSVWMSGDRRALYFWVLQRHSVHREPELWKVAGEYQAPRMSYGLGRYGVWRDGVWRDGVWRSSPFFLRDGVWRDGVWVAIVAIVSYPLVREDFVLCALQYSVVYRRQPRTVHNATQGVCCSMRWHVPSACLDMPRSSRACHSPQGNSNQFVVSSKGECWPTHRRIVGTIWARDWEIQKVVMAERADGDKRVAHVL